MEDDLQRGMDLGRIAYDAYLDSTGGKSLISGVLLPEFEALPRMIQVAWGKAAIAVAMHQAESAKKFFLSDGSGESPQ